jgi:DNA invertase Pin-like site-specific DNA recombinase
MRTCYVYLRTSGDDGKRKAGIPVQRDACAAFAAKAECEIVAEFADDGVTGKTPMHSRPQGKLLIAALLGNGVKTVLCYDAKRIGRTQPAFWSFAGLCRDNGIALLAADGTDLLDSVQGGIHGLMAEMDRNATVARLADGEKKWRGTRRCEGRWPYGQHPNHEYDAERAVVVRIEQKHAEGCTPYLIAAHLRAEGILTRYGKQFSGQAVGNILKRKILERGKADETRG